MEIALVQIEVPLNSLDGVVIDIGFTIEIDNQGHLVKWVFEYSVKRKALSFLMVLVAHNLCAQPFDGLTEAIERSDYGNLKAMVISQQGEIVYEQYFRGTYSYDLHLLNSVTKSVGSALIGIAHRQGKIQLDQTLDDFFASLYSMGSPVFRDKKAISVEDVL